MLNQKQYNILIFIGIIGFVYLLKLFYLQVIDTTYSDLSKSNTVHKLTVFPYRGLIRDRHDKMMVMNMPVYDLMVIPKEVNMTDTISFASLLGLNMVEFRQKLKDARKYSKLKPSIFIPTLSNEDFARIQDALVDNTGFYVNSRSVRTYPEPAAANVMGYIGEISPKQLLSIKNNEYRSGDFIGLSGLEKQYETVMRGKRGVKYVLVDVRGVEKGSFLDGAYDTASVAGEDIRTSIDYKLQTYGEKLMKNKQGSIVAIEPSTGEILCMVSSASYDPNLLVGKNFSKSYRSLVNDSLLPLYNRAIQATYPPGSIFKIIESLIGLQEKVIDSNTSLPCNKSIINCHNHGPTIGMRGALKHSCNPYYYVLFNRILQRGTSHNIFVDAERGFDTWRYYVTSFGLSTALGIDLPNEKNGRVPSNAYFDRAYGDKRWAFSTIFSLGIGQGEILVVPIQMANLAAIIANRGYYYIPHLIKQIGGKDSIPQKYKEKHYTKIDAEYFPTLVNAMTDVVESGTAYRSKIKGVVFGGKTGTAQNPMGEDHSVFVAFAPRDNPKIALAVYVENAGFGDKWAAPLASLMIEKYLNDTITRQEIEKKIIDKNINLYNAKLREVLMIKAGVNTRKEGDLLVRQYFREKMSKVRKKTKH